MQEHDERLRLTELQEYGLLDAPADEELEAVVRLAAAVAGVPTATLNLLDATRLCQLTTVGFTGGTSPRREAMCDVRLLDQVTVNVRDASRHPDYAANPWVDGRRGAVRFYASVPLVTPAGNALGTLCVFDAVPRELPADRLALLEDAARVVVALFERRRQARRTAELAERAERQHGLLAQAMRDREAHQELTDAVLDTVDVAIVAADADGRLTLFNRAAREWHGLDADHAVEPGQHAERYRLFDVDGRTPLPADAVPLARALHEGTVQRAEMVIAPRGRETVRVAVSGRALHDRSGTLLGAVVAMSDVTADRQRHAALQARHSALEQDNADLEHRATHDPLTGLPNRRLLRAHLVDALALARAQDSPLAVIYIDLDGFKHVNDTHGHDAGDALLVEVADRLRHGLRAGDIVARLGGDEFVMVCADVHDARAARAIATRVAAALRAPLHLDGTLLRASGSVGTALSGPTSTADGLLAQADDEMYRDKRQRSARVPLPARAPASYRRRERSTP